MQNEKKMYNFIPQNREMKSLRLFTDENTIRLNNSVFSFIQKRITQLLREKWLKMSCTTLRIMATSANVKCASYSLPHLRVEWSTRKFC